MEEQNYTKTALYGLGRLGIVALVNFFAVGVTLTAITSLMSLFSSNGIFDPNDFLRSLISYAILLLIMLAVFWDDAKRHTGYATYDAVNLTIIVIAVMATYYAPTFLYKYIESDKVLKVFDWFYFPHNWLLEIAPNIETAVLLGVIILTVLFVLAYVISHKLFVAKRSRHEIRDALKNVNDVK